jgi:drug/metabolite transporter (DMT)-like permease
MNQTDPSSGEKSPKNGELVMNTEGILWALTSGLTEAIMYVFIIAGGSLFNNHLVVMTALYFWSGILGILYILYQQCFSTSGTCSGVIVPETEGEPPAFSWAGLGMVGINLLLGVGGMTLQHGSARVIPTGTYATLSYIGVLFAYIYGLFMGDTLRIRDLIGSAMILSGSLFGGIV